MKTLVSIVAIASCLASTAIAGELIFADGTHRVVTGAENDRQNAALAKVEGDREATLRVLHSFPGWAEHLGHCGQGKDARKSPADQAKWCLIDRVGTYKEGIVD